MITFTMDEFPLWDGRTASCEVDVRDGYVEEVRLIENDILVLVMEEEHLTAFFENGADVITNALEYGAENGN